MKAFVINLDVRSDRWNDVMAQQRDLGLQIVRVPAVNISSVEESPYVTKVIAATWQSHQKAMRLFLESDEEYALIMEDDFLLKHKEIKKSIDDKMNLDVDFLQLGFLITNHLDRVQFIINDSVDFCLKILAFISLRISFMKTYFGSRLLIREQRGIPLSIVCNDIRPGAHAYIVSRKFAQFVTKINKPAFLSADAVYISMGWMRTFKMYRLRRSYISQSDSYSSIDQRFVSN